MGVRFCLQLRTAAALGCKYLPPFQDLGFLSTPKLSSFGGGFEQGNGMHHHHLCAQKMKRAQAICSEPAEDISVRPLTCMQFKQFSIGETSTKTDIEV